MWQVGVAGAAGGAGAFGVATGARTGGGAGVAAVAVAGAMGAGADAIDGGAVDADGGASVAPLVEPDAAPAAAPAVSAGVAAGRGAEVPGAPDASGAKRRCWRPTPTHLADAPPARPRPVPPRRARRRPGELRDGAPACPPPARRRRGATTASSSARSPVRGARGGLRPRPGHGHDGPREARRQRVALDAQHMGDALDRDFAPRRPEGGERRRQLGHVLEPPLRVLLEALADDGLEPAGDVGPEARTGTCSCCRIASDAARACVSAANGGAPGEQLVEDDAERPDVGPRVDGLRTSASARATCRAASP